jgi:hypothetical protein
MTDKDIKKNTKLYRVTGAFGDSPEGEIRYCVVLMEMGHTALIYHPAQGDMCGSIEVAEIKNIRVGSSDDYVGTHRDVYESVDTNEGWLNVESGNYILPALKKTFKSLDKYFKKRNLVWRNAPEPKQRKR